MASFSVDDIDVDPTQFMNECSRWEIDEVIDWLTDGGYIKSKGGSQPTINDGGFLTNVEAISKSKHLLTVEEEETINRIGAKFRDLY
jgi:hypothetical protein